MDVVIQVIGAFLAILAFSAAIDAPKKYVPWCGLTGAVGWFVYLMAKPELGIVPANFLGAMAIALCSHILARVFRAPVTVFLISGILTLVPGADLYRSVYNFLVGLKSLAGMYLTQAVQIAGAIAVAVFVTDSLFTAFWKHWNGNKSPKHKEK